MDAMQKTTTFSMRLIIVFALSLFVHGMAMAQATRHPSDFNHMQTGFSLTGAHVKLECETCHVGGVFKGTPMNCDGCHSAGRRVIATSKSAKHVPTSAPCDTCHTNTTTFLGIRFNHIGVQPKACTTCHNGMMAPGKHGGHLLTTAQCDSCHRNSAWVPAGYDHLSASPAVTGRCSQCHNNVTALGKHPQHTPTTAECDTCHTNTNYVTFAGLTYDHAGVIPGQCGTCHTGQSAGAPVQPPTHIPYSGLGCDNCHGTPPAATTFSSPLPAMNHGAVAGIACSKCHNGSYKTQVGTLGLGAQSKADKPNHTNTTAECNVCHHSYTTFAGATVDHGLLNPPATGRCKDCHDGGGATGVTKSAVHIPTSNQCDACHTNYVAFPGVGATMNHAVESGQACTACHSGGHTTQGSKYGGAKAMTSISNHIPVTNTDCKVCHTGFTSFTTPLSSSTIMHTAVSTVCTTCHATGTSYRGNMTRMSLSHKTEALQPGQALTDCSQSSCHRPVGTIGTSYIRWTN